MATVTAAASAAREAWLQPEPTQEATFSDVESRLLRYRRYWDYYTNNLYNQLSSHKGMRGLYRHIRPIYNPATRLVDFYVAKVYGGELDMEAGLTGAVPIVTDNKAVREAITQVWQWSNWQAKKQLFVRWGACLGDVALKVVDDVPREKVYLQVLHPRMINDAQFDWRGNITSAIIEYTDWEPSPIAQGQYVEFTYTERITKDLFATFKNNQPWDYYGNGPSWPNPYGFVPLVLAVHKDCGLDWGLSAFHADDQKIDELNDQASIMNDRLRKANNPQWLMAGARGKSEIDLSTSDATTSEAARQTTNVLYGPENATATPLVTDIGLAQSLENLRELLSELERDYPELALHRMRESGGAWSGRAISLVYQDASDRVTEARGNYDGALVRAQQMALSIGGMRRYDGFESFGLESYERGDEDHRIGSRSVLASGVDPQQIDLAVKVGVPGRFLWDKLGLDFTQDQLDEMRKEEEEEPEPAWNLPALAMAQAGQQQAQPGQPGQQPPPGQAQPPEQEEDQDETR